MVICGDLFVSAGVVVCWLLNGPATCFCTPEKDLLKQ